MTTANRPLSSARAATANGPLITADRAAGRRFAPGTFPWPRTHSCSDEASLDYRAPCWWRSASSMPPMIAERASAPPAAGARLAAVLHLGCCSLLGQPWRTEQSICRADEPVSVPEIHALVQAGLKESTVTGEVQVADQRLGHLTQHVGCGRLFRPPGFPIRPPRPGLPGRSIRAALHAAGTC